LSEKLKINSRKFDALVNGFVEIEITKGDLLSSPKKIDEYLELLKANLPPGSPETDWSSELDSIWGHPDFDSNNEELESIYIHKAADTILYIHGLLKSFWEEYKEKVQAFHEVYEEIEKIQTEPDDEEEKSLRGLDALEEYQEYQERRFELINRESRQLRKAKVPINFDYETGRLCLEGTIMDFMNLLNEITAANIRKCKNDKCGKWFGLTSKHRREYCNQRCAAKHLQAIFRKEEPEAFKKYHRKFYNDNYKRERKAPDTKLRKIT
jgi:hypothetical protein